MEEKSISSAGFFYGFLVCLLAVFSCTSETKMENTVATTASPAVLTNEQLLELGIQKLDEWGSYWKRMGADIHSFKLEQEHVYEPLEWPGENVFAGDNPLQKYQIPHPSAEGVVDIYSYKLVFAQDQALSFNPDSEVVYYRNDGMRERLLFMGPSGVFEDAVWVTEDHLLVSGHVQKADGYVPVLWLITPKAHKYVVFESDFYTQDYASENYLKEKLKDVDPPA